MKERKIVLDGSERLRDLLTYLRTLPLDGRIEVLIRPFKKKRSVPRNAGMWGYVTAEFAEQAWVDGRQFDVPTWHMYLKKRFLPEGNEEDFSRMVTDVDKYTKWAELPDGSLECIGSTTSLTTYGMEVYLEQIHAYGAGELGIRFPADTRGR